MLTSIYRILSNRHIIIQNAVVPYAFNLKMHKEVRTNLLRNIVKVYREIFQKTNYIRFVSPSYLDAHIIRLRKLHTVLALRCYKPLKRTRSQDVKFCSVFIKNMVSIKSFISHIKH